jgi:hypothetical protein
VHGVAQHRHVLGARHGVVHERAGDELARVGVIDRVLHQRLAEAGGDAAVQLAFDDHRIERAAAIVDRGIAGDLDRAGRRIDLDLGDVHAVGEGLRRLGDRFGVEVFGYGAHLFEPRGVGGDIKQRHAPVGADHFESAVLVSDVGLASLEHAGGDRFGFGEHLSDRFHHRMAHGHRRARAHGSIAW